MGFLHQVVPSLAAPILQIRVKNLHEPRAEIHCQVSTVSCLLGDGEVRCGRVVGFVLVWFFVFFFNTW